MKIVLISHTKERVTENHCPNELIMCFMTKSAFGKLPPEGIEAW